MTTHTSEATGRAAGGGLTLLLVIGVLAAIAVRYALRDFASVDFTHYTSLWYAAIQAQGMAATGTAVSNYTPPYLYLLYLVSVTFPGLAPVVAIKLASLPFDALAATFVWLIVRRQVVDRRVAVLAAVAVLLAPTVVVNGSMWGQADSIYTAWLIGCVWALMAGRATVACLCFGAALAFKAQAVFLAPVLCALWLTGALGLRHLLLVPAVYAVAMLPAWFAGRPAGELAGIYLSQGETFHNLTRNAPNLYAWLSDRYYRPLVLAGLGLAAGSAALFVWLVWRNRARLDESLILRLSLCSLLLMPFVLPKMHERYFFPADVLSIAYACCMPRQRLLPLLVIPVSWCAYQPFLLGYPLVSLRMLALFMGLALAIVAWSTLEALRPRRAADIPGVVRISVK